MFSLEELLLLLEVVEEVEVVRPVRSVQRLKLHLSPVQTDPDQPGSSVMMMSDCYSHVRSLLPSSSSSATG